MVGMQERHGDVGPSIAHLAPAEQTRMQRPLSYADAVQRPAPAVANHLYITSKAANLQQSGESPQRLTQPFPESASTAITAETLQLPTGNRPAWARGYLNFGGYC